ncbi:MAG: hypothetical protein R2785_05450 [Flavobacteriaceae bacterium]
MNKVIKCYIIILLLLIVITNCYSQEIQRVRVDFKTPLNYTRHLLLGFTPDNAASDQMDYGYDALCVDELDDDLNWMINNQRFVIQGVGEFNENKSYRFGMFMSNSGNVTISLNSLENFESPINVFIYDALTNTFNRINENGFNLSMNSGEYLNRFFITFQNATPPAGALSISDNELNRLSISTAQNSKELAIDTKTNIKLDKVEILDILGKKVFDANHINKSRISVPLQHIKSKIIIVSIYANNSIIRKKLIINNN